MQAHAVGEIGKCKSIVSHGARVEVGYIDAFASKNINI